MKARFGPRAVIFDMDGVLVDSMVYHFISWYEALRPYGVRVSCFEVYSREGECWDKSLRELFVKSGVKADKKLLKRAFARKNKLFGKYFKRFIFSGAKEILADLKKKGYLLGLVTGTPAAEVKRILPEDIRGLFDCVVAGDQVKKGKPSPEPYLRASAALKTAPDSCLVVENAPLGIISAKKAGMSCCALTTSLPGEYLKGADALAADLKDIPGLLKRRIK